MKYYKPASTNVNKGHKTHGNFKNSGQKEGVKTPKGKEKLASTDPVQAKLRKISKAMFARKKALNNDVAMRAQLNG